MDPEQARLWLVRASLGITGACFVFFLLAPLAGFPLTYPQALRLLEILTPVFFGYLGSATRFLFGTAPSAPLRAGQNRLLGTMVRGPVAVFSAGILASIVAFGITNRAAASPGIGLSVDTLALVFAICLALLAGTTGALVSYLFAQGQKTEAASASSSPPVSTGS